VAAWGFADVEISTPARMPIPAVRDIYFRAPHTATKGPTRPEVCFVGGTWLRLPLQFGAGVLFRWKDTHLVEGVASERRGK